MKEFRSVPIRWSLSGISTPWESIMACSRSLHLNKNKALALGECGSLHASWPPVLLFGYNVNLHMGLSVEVHSSHCKYPHWNQEVWVRAIWWETRGLVLKYVFIFLGECILTCGFLVFACTCCVHQIFLQNK